MDELKAAAKRVRRVFPRRRFLAAAGGSVAALQALAGHLRPVEAQEAPVSSIDPEADGDPEPRPIVVQIDNDPRARPSSNLGAARIVYEYPAEGGVTRFSAMFFGDQEDVGTIGNVRSGRLATIEIVQQFNAILAYHGGSIGVQERIWNSWIDFISFELEENYPFFTRVPWRRAPYNSFTDLPRIRQAAEQKGIPLLGRGLQTFPVGPFEAVGAETANRLTLPYQAGFGVRYEYDPATNTYWRFMDDRPHWDDGIGAQITTQNVIVQFVPSYMTDIVEDIYGSKSLDYQLQGQGPAWIMRDGKLIECTWQRGDSWDFTTFYDVMGRVVPLAPGTAWISLVGPDDPAEAWYEGDQPASPAPQDTSAATETTSEPTMPQVDDGASPDAEPAPEV